jgi:sodium-dependent phosphate cotransporter
LAAIAGLLYVFLVSIGLIGKAFKLFGAGFAETLLSTTADPVVGLFIGILATATVQSSSTTTSVVVGMVGGGALNVAGAIPIIMGANIGTSVTNTIVSVGHIGRPVEFRRAFAASTVHDFFNLIAVTIFFSLEQAFGLLEQGARLLADLFVGLGGLHIASPVRMLTKPSINALTHLAGDEAWIVLALAFILLFFSLTWLVKVLRALVLSRIETFFSRTIFKTAIRAMLLGLFVTAAVQSSSIATSVVIPLAAAGVLRLEQIFPYTLGSNVGTTVTAILASMATGEVTAIVVALVHLLFNIFGIIVVWPIRRLPIAMARGLAELTLRSRLIPVAYIVLVFFMVPLIVYWVF